MLAWASEKRVKAFGCIVLGVCIGVGLASGSAVVLLPSLMLVQARSQHDFEGTVSLLEQRVSDAGWSLVSSTRMNESLAKHGVEFSPRIQLLKICKAAYAERVLTDQRQVAALMPCTIAVYETDDGHVMVSKMNTRLLGKLFGGTVSEVMGGDVARDEAVILQGISG